MIATYRKENVTYKLITMAVLAAALFFVIRIVYAGIIALPYPKELLEASNVSLTNEFLAGRSPYTIASLARFVPGTNYDYPFMNSLIAATIAKITGCTAVTAHFIISLGCILASGVIGFVMTLRCSKTTVAPSIAFILFMFCHWRFGYISAAPDDLGLLLLLLTSLAATSPMIRKKPLWCAIGITVCFYTKQYYVFVAVGIFIYMFMCSRREGIKLFIWTTVINVVVGVLITVFWPLYWTKAFLFTYLGTAVGGGGAITTFIYQLKYLAVLFAALFAIIVYFAARALRNLYRNNKKLSSIRINENDPFALSAAQSVVMLIPLFFIGRNDGAILSYFLQLWIPFVILTALVCFERMLPDNGDKDPIHRIDVKNAVFSFIYLAIAAFTLYLGFGKLPLHVLSDQEIKEWKKAYDYTRKYSEEGDVFYSRALAYDGFIRGNGEWMCGHEGEVEQNTYYGLEKAGIKIDNFPYISRIVDQNVAYRANMLEKAENYEYSLITFETEDHFSIFNQEVCNQYGYTCIDTVTLQLGNMPYEVKFYARRDIDEMGMLIKNMKGGKSDVFE